MTSTRRARWPYFGLFQTRLLIAAVAILAGSLLPWGFIFGRGVRGAPLAVLWSLWAGLMTLGGAMAPKRALAISSALLGGATAVGFALWQSWTIIRLCFSFDCLPGFGLGLLLGGGGAAIYQAARLFTSRRTTG